MPYTKFDYIAVRIAGVGVCRAVMLYLLHCMLVSPDILLVIEDLCAHCLGGDVSYGTIAVAYWLIGARVGL